jgi:hypothetical protein
MNTAALIVAIGFAAMGIAALVRPAFIWAPFGAVPTTPEARSEVRAVYGGFGLAIAGLLFLTDDSAGLRDGVLLAVAVSLAGMAAGRLVSALVEPRTLLRSPGFFLVVEAGLAALTLAAR